MIRIAIVLYFQRVCVRVSADTHSLFCVETTTTHFGFPIFQSQHQTTIAPQPEQKILTALAQSARRVVHRSPIRARQSVHQLRRFVGSRRIRRRCVRERGHGGRRCAARRCHTGAVRRASRIERLVFAVSAVQSGLRRTAAKGQQQQQRQQHRDLPGCRQRMLRCGGGGHRLCRCATKSAFRSLCGSVALYPH